MKKTIVNEIYCTIRMVSYFLFSLYRLSAVPSFLVWVVAGAVFAASLFDLYRISAVPSFFVGPAAVAGLAVEAVAGFAVDAVAGLAVEVVAGFVVVVLAGFFVFAGVVCAFV